MAKAKAAEVQAPEGIPEVVLRTDKSVHYLQGGDWNKISVGVDTEGDMVIQASDETFIYVPAAAIAAFKKAVAEVS